MPLRAPVRLLLASALALAAAAGLAAWLRARGAEPIVDAGDRIPAGRWRLAPPAPGASGGGGRRADTPAPGTPDPGTLDSGVPNPGMPDPGALDADARARLLSLPYQAGSRGAPERAGVLRWDRQRAAPGVNLYVSGHGPEALLIDLEGRLLHRWRRRFEEAFPGRAPSAETPFFRRARLLADGGLAAIYQGGGLVRLDRRSRVLWTVAAGFYNDLAVTADGSIWGIAKAARIEPSIDAERPILEDSLVLVGPDGEVRRRLSLLEAFRQTPFEALLRPMPPHGDIFHTNTVVPLAATGSAPTGGGHLLVSLREVDVVAAVDPASGKVVWARRGPWRAQHDPRPVGGARLLLFDNRGLGSHSRAIEFDPGAGAVVWQYDGSRERPLDSREAGACQRLAGGNTLVVESERGRAIEVTRDGEIVWEFVSPHRAGSRRELIATLFDLVRLPVEAAAFTRRGTAAD